MFSFDEIKPLSEPKIRSIGLQHSFLFELAFARTEQIVAGFTEPDWKSCARIATARQRRHFDSRFPVLIPPEALELAAMGANNLYQMLHSVSEQYRKPILANPVIPGLGWISSGNGDFSVGTTLIEVKNTDRNFISADFRQILLYLLLHYASNLEIEEDGFASGLLLNPRRNAALWINFDEVTRAASGGMGRIEVYERLRTIVGDSSDFRQ